MSVMGKVPPERLKPDPVITAELTVTGTVPVEFRVTDCGVAAVFTVTLPKARLPALTVRVGTDADNWRAKVFDTLPAVADRVAVCAEVTAETVALNPALVAFAGIVTVEGTLTAGSALERLTVSPVPDGAALRLTRHESVPDPVMDVLLQVSPVSAGTPVPLRVTAVLGLVEELLVNVSCPVTAPETVGWNCRLSVAD